MTAHEDYKNLAPYEYSTVPMQRLAATLPWYAAEQTEPPDTSSDQYPMLWLKPETGMLYRYNYELEEWSPIGEPLPGNGYHALSLGRSSATGVNSIAIGSDANATGAYGVVIGERAADSQNMYGAIVIGPEAKVTESGDRGIAIGDSAETHRNHGIAIGRSAVSGTGDTGYSAIAVGAESSALGDEATALGTSASVGVTVYAGTAVGAQAVATLADPEDIGEGLTALGYGASSSAGQATALGAFSKGIGEQSTALGAYASANESQSTAVGAYSYAYHPNSVAIGTHATTEFENHATVRASHFDVNAPGGASHLILNSPNGSRWEISVDDTGTISAAPFTPPVTP